MAVSRRRPRALQGNRQISTDDPLTETRSHGRREILLAHRTSAGRSRILLRDRPFVTQLGAGDIRKASAFRAAYGIVLTASRQFFRRCSVAVVVTASPGPGTCSRPVGFIGGSVRVNAMLLPKPAAVDSDGSTVGGTKTFRIPETRCRNPDRCRTGVSCSVALRTICLPQHATVLTWAAPDPGRASASRPRSRVCP